jgi:hypothetical protein
VIRSEKKLGELSAILKNKNPESTGAAIAKLRDEEPFEGAIALLASFYEGCTDRPVMKIIEEFFNDIKDQSARPEVVAEIRKPLSPQTLSMLVSSCWQSGLDYSSYICDIARVFLTADYATSIECMTVIEESVQSSSRTLKDEAINILMESPSAFTHEKNALTRELISILQR